MEKGKELFQRLLRSSSDVIQIGTGGERVVQVSSERVEYIDSAGEERVVDLAACARNWARFTSQQRCFPAPAHVLERLYHENHCIGRSGDFWVQFMDRRPQTLFEFPTEHEWRKFIRLTKTAGWEMYDSDAAGERARGNQSP